VLPPRNPVHHVGYFRRRHRGLAALSRYSLSCRNIDLDNGDVGEHLRNFALLGGGRFRTFFIATAVTPPFLLVLPGWIQSAVRHPEYPIAGFVEYFLYCVAAPILLVWVVAKLINGKEQKNHAWPRKP
jgi:hypothetical protein